jgi:hypothetical protein
MTEAQAKAIKAYDWLMASEHTRALRQELEALAAQLERLAQAQKAAQAEVQERLALLKERGR